jgi:hypothetical protein
MPPDAVFPWRDMKTTSSQSDIAGKYSKLLGGAFRSALFTWCLGAALYWSAACVPPNGGWQSQPESQQEQQQEPPAADGDGAAAYEGEALFDGTSESGYGSDGDGTGDGSGGGGGGSAWSCKAQATLVDQSVISAIGAGDTRQAASNDAFSNCHALVMTQMQTDRINDVVTQVATDCAVSDCTQ